MDVSEGTDDKYHTTQMVACKNGNYFKDVLQRDRKFTKAQIQQFDKQPCDCVHCNRDSPISTKEERKLRKRTHVNLPIELVQEALGGQDFDKRKPMDDRKSGGGYRLSDGKIIG